MPVHNNDIAQAFDKIAGLLELQGANRYRIRAYRNASRTVGGNSQDIARMVRQEEDLTSLSGIGKDLAQKIEEFVSTGKLRFLEDLAKEIPPELTRLMEMEGLGPKRVKLIHEKLGVNSLEDLARAAEENKLRELPGLGVKTEKRIREEIARADSGTKRWLWSVAQEYARPLMDYLKNSKGLKSIDLAGSFRRGRQTVHDLDILVTCRKESDVARRFIEYDEVRRVISRGETRTSVLLRCGLQVDLRIVPQVCYGAALYYFTGSREHNVAVRRIAVKKNLKINEYGVFRNDKRVAGKTEQEVFRAVGLSYVDPELRENRGEIEAAQNGRLPGLVTLKQIKGDLHTHTKTTDGRHTLRQMAEAAQKKGYEYIANTEHSRHLTVARGLDEQALRRRIREIDKLNRERKGLVVLKGIEVDILEDGSLDLPDRILKELDVVVGAIHSKFRLSQDRQTARILKALDNPYLHILAHPTGRLINERDPYDADWDRIMTAAAGTGCCLELNAQPQRLDLNDALCRMAKRQGVKIAVSSDAHSRDGYDVLRYGINQARRGWLESRDVINTRSLKELRKVLRSSS